MVGCDTAPPAWAGMCYESSFPPADEAWVPRLLQVRACQVTWDPVRWRDEEKVPAVSQPHPETPHPHQMSEMPQRGDHLAVTHRCPLGGHSTLVHHKTAGSRPRNSQWPLSPGSFRQRPR